MLLNFEAGRRIAHAFIPTMREQRHGRIICLTGQDEPREVNAANAPNGAVHIWAKAMSRHLAGEGITINCLPPGRIHSEQVDRRIMASEATQRAAIQDIPVGFVGEPRDLSCLARVPLFTAGALHHGPGDPCGWRHAPLQPLNRIR
jgi:3-oxoacyl-[acyl-carrier protein] reductase